jgi:hypothetical protein
MSHKFNPITQTPFLGGHDSAFFERVQSYLEENKFSPHEALEYWPLLSRRTTLQRFLALDELIRATLDVPGDIAEFGVWQGHSLLTWGNLLEIHCNTDRSKQVFGFDTFTGFTQLDEEDGSGEDVQQRRSLLAFKQRESYQRLVGAIELYDSDRFVAWKPRIHLVKGDVNLTLPDWIKNNGGRRFSLVYLDLDVYAPTKIVLDNVWSLVPKGGIVAFDEYAKPAWPGESLAVDEFFYDKSERIRKFTWTSSPGGYVVKGAR